MTDEDAAALLNEYCTRERRTYVEVLQDFPSAAAKLPLAHLVALVPRLRPRYFSIAAAQQRPAREAAGAAAGAVLGSPSAPLGSTADRVHLTVAIVHYKTAWYKREKWGACSRYLASLGVGDELPLYIAAGKMRLPEDPRTPLVLVGPGTGVAPMKAMVEERAAQLCKLGAAPASASASAAAAAAAAASALAPASASASAAVPPAPPALRGSCALYFGCCHEAFDFLYNREGVWASLMASPAPFPTDANVLDELSSRAPPCALTALHTAFSRDQAQKIYVQARVRENARAVYDALAPPELGGQNGVVFVAGGTKMSSAVAEALADVFGAAGSPPRGKAHGEALLRRMEREGRYVCESWS